VYGDRSSTRVVVLFGDSHALMWLPALAPAASADHFKLVVLWQGVCPPGDLSVYWPAFGDPPICNAWRAQMVTLIHQISPVTVLLAGRTTDVESAPGKNFTNAQWAEGLEKTIDQLSSPRTKVAVIEDTVYFDQSVIGCLSVNPSAVRRCAVPFPNPQNAGLQAGEAAAAKATGATFIATRNWFCTSTCSAVIGDYFPFIDSNHVSFAYAQFLSGVMGAAVRPLL
jgi:hypothetical protein